MALLSDGAASPGRIEHRGGHLADRSSSALGYPEPSEAFAVGLHSTKERFGDFLPVLRLPKEFFVARIGEKGDFRKDRGHIGADQDHERSSLHAAIFLASPCPLRAGVDLALDLQGEVLRFPYFLGQGNLLDKTLKLVYGLFR